jgi:citrate lyase subunit beta/citryl-CoA lyase
MMRSKLFVPASRPELFTKAMSSAADAISFDLEDAVEEGQKGFARQALVDFFEKSQTQNTKAIVVRINAMDTTHYAGDLEAVVSPAVQIINLPMVESAAAVRDLSARMSKLEADRRITRPIGILVNIESPRGLRQAAELALADPRVVGLQIGFGDLFGPYGIESCEPSATQVVRVLVKMAAAEAGIDVYDGAYADIANPDGFTLDAQAAYRLGFTGKSCIHPSQVGLANAVFRPSAHQIQQALRVVQAAEENLARGVGAFVVDGQLVDGPLITRAERTVSLAREAGLL